MSVATEPAAVPQRSGQELVRVTDLVKHFPITSGVFIQRQVAAVFGCVAGPNSLNATTTGTSSARVATV